MEAGGEPGLGAMKITPSRTARLDGFFAMNIDYRLVNSTFAPACYQDMYTAIRWVHVHAAEYHIDTSRICLMGNSSGGHEVALAATLGEGPYGKTGGWDKESEDFRAAISFSGAYDLNTLSRGKSVDARCRQCNDRVHNTGSAALEEARRIASPMQNIGPRTKPMLPLECLTLRAQSTERQVGGSRSRFLQKSFHLDSVSATMESGLPLSKP